MNQHDLQSKKIIFFDGVCVLCNSFVDEVMKRDKQNIFFLSPLQGETAKIVLSTEQRKLDKKGDPTSVIYWRDGKVYTKSNAVIRIAKDMDGSKKLLKIFTVLPVNVADKVYGLVAKFRYKVFGKIEVCRIPSEDEKKKFLL